MGEAPSLPLRQQRASAPAHGRHPVGKDSDGSSPSRSGSGPSTAKGHAGALAPSLHCRAQQGGPLWKPQRRQQTQERRRGAPARGRPRRARGAPWKVDRNATFSGREARRCLWMPDLPAFILGRLFFFSTQIEKTALKFILNHKRPQVAKAIPRKNKAECSVCPDFKL